MKDTICQEEDLFTIVNNDLLKDPKLSMQAKGLYAYLRSNHTSWKIYKTEIYNHFSNGRDAISSAWKELVESGWLISERNQEDGKMNGWTHKVLRARGGKSSESPTYWNPDLLETRKTGNPPLIKNNNNNKQYNNKRYVADATCDLESIWSEFREVYKKSASPIGNKAKSLSIIKKQLDKKDLILDTIIQHSNEVIKLQKSGQSRTLPNLVTFLNQKRWEQPITDYFKTANVVKLNTTHNFNDRKDWGVSQDGSIT